MEILSETPQQSEHYVVAWDTTPRVAFTLPFRDVKRELFFDSVLPRIIELAEKSGDRQLLVSSCTVLCCI